jgi:transcriptional regulator with XRE-family HTH domain
VGNRDEVKAFLTSRRAKVTPEQPGLSTFSRTRRVPGLRRSEVADLAGVSVEYYAQLERGNLAGASESVLDALARALQLDEAERDHLLALARAAGPVRRSPRARPAAQQIRSSVVRVLQGMTEVPAIVQNGRLDVLATNPLARALFAPVFADLASPANLARFTFLDPHARTLFGNWSGVADDTVALLRTEAGRDPFDKPLIDLVGELATRSDECRLRWAAHDVRLHRTGLKHIQHPVVGALHLSYEVMDLTADPGMTLVVYSAAEGSADDDALRLLASWAATHEPADAVQLNRYERGPFAT